MLTATARKHIVRALRSALNIREAHAIAITETTGNAWQLDMLTGDLRGLKALIIDNDTSAIASMFLNSGDGFVGTGVSLKLDVADLKRWRLLDRDAAYAIAAEIAGNMHVPEVTPLADNDDDDMWTDMDQIFGPVPEPRDFKWVDGEVISARIADEDHIIVSVRLEGADADVDMTMVPTFPGVSDLLAHVSAKIGKPADLSVGRINSFDTQVPAGLDRSLPFLGMVVLKRDAHRLMLAA